MKTPSKNEPMAIIWNLIAKSLEIFIIVYLKLSGYLPSTAVATATPVATPARKKVPAAAAT